MTGLPVSLGAAPVDRIEAKEDEVDLQRIVSMAANLQVQALAAAQAAQARMDFFEKTGFAGGRWDVNLPDGPATAGETLSGHVSFDPDAPIPATRLRVRVVGLEVAAYDQRTTRRGASTTQDETHDERLFRPTDLGQFATVIELAMPPVPGAPLELDFALPIPSWAPPSVSLRSSSGAPLYEIKWVLECAAVANTDDPDPSTCCRAPIVIAQVCDGATPGMAPGSLDSTVQSDGNPSCAIELTPVPLVAGAQFAGRAQLSGFDTGKMRAVIEAVVATKEPPDVERSGGISISFGGTINARTEVSVSGVNETIELWRGPISGGSGELQFGGVAPYGAAVEGPNGRVSLRLSVVEDRRFMPDRNWRRPLVITTKPPRP